MNLKKTKKQAEKVLAEVQDLAYWLAWDASAQYNIPFDECLREAYWQFMKAWNYYDPEKHTKFSTFYTMIYKWQIKSRVKSHIKRQQQLPQVEFKENLRGVLKLVEHPPATRSPCLEVLEDLSEDAREIVRLILETPAELLENVRTPSRLLSRVKYFLLNNQGYSQSRFRKAQAEVRTKLRERWRHERYSEAHPTDYACKLVAWSEGQPWLTHYARQLVARGR